MLFDHMQELVACALIKLYYYFICIVVVITQSQMSGLTNSRQSCPVLRVQSEACHQWRMAVFVSRVFAVVWLKYVV